MARAFGGVAGLAGGSLCVVLVQLGEGVGEERLVLGEVELVVAAGGDDDVVRPVGVAGQVVLGQAEGLADVALEAVSADGAPHYSADGEAQAVVRQLVRPGEDDERPLGLAEFGGVDGFELPRVGEAEFARERKGGGHGGV